MLVDLGRNDVGRVARSARCDRDEQMTVERYSHVMHIVSNVDGELADGKTAFDAAATACPPAPSPARRRCGRWRSSTSSSPRARPSTAARSATSASGGDMDTCIAAAHRRGEGRPLYVQAGGGVVYDSDPAAEYEETVNKAKGPASGRPRRRPVPRRARRQLSARERCRGGHGARNVRDIPVSE